MKTIYGAAFGVLLMAAYPAQAQTPAPMGWTGEGALSGGFTSGNTTTTDISAGLKAAGNFGDWGVKAQLTSEYGKSNGRENRNRTFLAAQGERNLDERFNIYARTSYEADRFSGFKSRMYLGVGVGYRVFLGPGTTWLVGAGPGWRRDQIRLSGLTKTSVGFRFGSNFLHKFNDDVSFSNDTEYLTADTSNQLINISAITANLVGALATRFSFEVRNESNPQLGRKATDTITRFSLVYGF